MMIKPGEARYGVRVRLDRTSKYIELQSNTGYISATEDAFGYCVVTLDTECHYISGKNKIPLTAVREYIDNLSFIDY